MASSSSRGSLAALGRKEEAMVLAKRGIGRFPGLLSIERLVLNRGWPPYVVTAVNDLMRRTSCPACATRQDLADTRNPARLPECLG